MKIPNEFFNAIDELISGQIPAPVPEEGLDTECRRVVTHFNRLIAFMDGFSESFKSMSRALQSKDHSLNELVDRLQVEERQSRTILDREPIPVVISRLADGQVLYANHRARAVFPLQTETAGAQQAKEFWVNPELRSVFVERISQEGHVIDYEVEYLGIDARTFHALLSANRMVFEGQDAILASFLPITERLVAERRLQETLDLNQKMVSASPLGIAVYRASSGQCVLVNPAMASIVGATEDELLAQKFRDIHSWQTSGLVEAAERCLATQETVQVTLGLRTTFGKMIWILATFAAFLAKDETHLLLMVKDVTDRVVAEKKLQEANVMLERLAREDGLTGLANRRHFNERLEAEIRRTRRAEKPLSVIVGDIDHFKLYNDRYGHPMGDACLISVAEVMQGLFKRGGDLVARIGGEEFAILLPETPLEAAAQLAEALRAAIESANIRHEDSQVASMVTLSLGVAGATSAMDRPSTWFMGAADKALYHSKANGRNRVTVEAVDL